MLSYYYTGKKDKMLLYQEYYFFSPLTNYMKKDIFK